MSRNKYDEGFGVARLRWHAGNDLDIYGSRLVEVWQSKLDLSHESTKPRVQVTASVQLWIWRKRVNLLGGTDNSYCWHRVDDGSMEQINLDAVKIRRWARLPMRNWYGTVALGGWRKP